jgi:hypothetical protein
MIITIYLPDALYNYFERFPDPRKAVEAAVAHYVIYEKEHEKATPYEDPLSDFING